jgi:hypothetical protein
MLEIVALIGSKELFFWMVQVPSLRQSLERNTGPPYSRWFASKKTVLHQVSYT